MWLRAIGHELAKEKERKGSDEPEGDGVGADAEGSPLLCDTVRAESVQKKKGKGIGWNARLGQADNTSLRSRVCTTNTSAPIRKQTRSFARTVSLSNISMQTRDGRDVDDRAVGLCALGVLGAEVRRGFADDLEGRDVVDLEHQLVVVVRHRVEHLRERGDQYEGGRSLSRMGAHLVRGEAGLRWSEVSKRVVSRRTDANERTLLTMWSTVPKALRRAKRRSAA